MQHSAPRTPSSTCALHRVRLSVCVFACACVSGRGDVCTISCKQICCVRFQMIMESDYDLGMALKSDVKARTRRMLAARRKNIVAAMPMCKPRRSTVCNVRHATHSIHIWRGTHNMGVYRRRCCTLSIVRCSVWYMRCIALFGAALYVALFGILRCIALFGAAHPERHLLVHWRGRLR